MWLRFLSLLASDSRRRHALSPVVGYVDDLELFLRGPADGSAFLTLIEQFGDVSGLVLNIAKCSSVCLHPRGSTLAHATMKIQPAEWEVTTRYLGIPISSVNTTKQVWTATIRAIQARTILAAHKTSDVEQRCKLAAAIIVPKVLYVARHCWPTDSIVDHLVKATHHFVWQGFSRVDGFKGTRSLLNADHSRIAVRNGGMGAPDIEAELRAMAAATVATWAQGKQLT